MAYSMDWLIENYLSFFAQFGLGEEDIRSHFEQWKQKSGSNSVKDYAWYLFQVLLGETARQVTNEADLYKNQFEIYSRMWEFRITHEKTKDNSLVRLMEEARIKAALVQLPYEFTVQVLTNCCPHCDQLKGKEFTPEDVLKNHYVGSEECTRESGCACRYLTVPKKDADGQLINKI